MTDKRENRYMIMEAVPNTTGFARVRYYVEPEDGGGIEFESYSLKEAVNYITNNNGVLTLLT